MSRNLGTSSCPKCGYTVRLSDIRGKTIEFRKHGPYAPVLGCRFDCSCGEVYFAMWRREDNYWDQYTLARGEWLQPFLPLGEDQTIPNHQQGRFAADIGLHGAENTGCFTIDLSYYATYNDEPDNDPDRAERIYAGLEKPRHLCEDDALPDQWVW